MGEPAPSPTELRELAEIAVCGPGPVLARAVARVFGPIADRATRMRRLCDVLLDGVRPYLDAPEFHLLFRERKGRPDRRAAMRRAVWDGNLEGVLDEFLAVEQGLGTRDPLGAREAKAFEALTSAVTLHDTRLSVDRLRSNANPMRLRCHAAVPFGLHGRAERGDEAPRADQLRTAFNTPFRPMALVTTSIGQEGLDFHRWARHLVHWDLPSNPVDLEQRDGRLNRFGSLAVRQALAKDVRVGELDPVRSPWHLIGDRARALEDPTGLVPWWFAPGAEVRRTMLVPSFSELESECTRLQEDLDLYRLALGQPDQEALLRRLQDRLKQQDEPTRLALRCWLRLVAIDLRPAALT